MPGGGRFRPSKAAESRWGESNGRFPPVPRCVSGGCGGRLHSLAAQVAEGCLNFRFQRKQPSANSPLATPDWLRCSRQEGCVLWVGRGDGGAAVRTFNGSAPAFRRAVLRGAGLIPHTDRQEARSETDRPCEAQEGSTAVDSMPTEERGESRGGGNPGQQVCLSQMYDVKEGFILPIHHDCGSFVVNGSGYDERKNLRHNRYFHCERSCTHEQKP